MAKIVVECADPNDLGAVEEAVEQSVGKCNITYFNQHLELVKAGKSSSERESARIIAKDTGESPGAARKRIQRGKKELGQVVPPQEGDWPQCKNVNSRGYRCVLSVKATRRNGEEVPAEHGFCHMHRRDQLREKKVAEHNAIIREEIKAPVDTEIDDLWNEILPKVNDLFMESEHESRPLIGKVKPETLKSIMSLRNILDEILKGVIELSERPREYG